MKNKKNIEINYFIPLIFIAVFLLSFFVFFEKTKAQTSFPPQYTYNECIDLGLKPVAMNEYVGGYNCADLRCAQPFSKYLCCIQIWEGSERLVCIDRELGTETLPPLAGEESISKKTQEKRVIKFIPNITIPGSITIGGKEIKFVAGEPTEVTGFTLGAWISLFYIFFCGVVGIFAVANIIFGGFKWLTSFGNASRISAAKERITSAVIGLFLTLGAFIILQTINPRLVEFRNLSINQIRTILQIESEVSSVKGAPPVSWDGGNVDTYDTQLLKAATLYGIDRDWLKALMLIESGGDPNAVSKDANGDPLACGLVQLLPSTAGMTCEELKNPDVNTMAAAKYYASLMKDTCPPRATTIQGETVVCDLPTNCEDGASTYANAAYNGGPGANCSSHDKNCKNMTWWECENNKGFAQTRAYVQKVQQAYDKIVKNGW